MANFNSRIRFLKKAVCGLLAFIFMLTSVGPGAYAQSLSLGAGAGVLPAPGARVSLSPAFNLPMLKGIKVYAHNPLKLDFILDKGDTAEALRPESEKLIRYFLASLTVPEKDLWVNLSPYEKDRIVPEAFGQTEMGRDLLAQDYILKQLTASALYPEDALGKEFWKKVYAKAYEKYGTTDIPVDTFHKVWILPSKAVVFEKAAVAYIVESKFKVMLESDYLAQGKNGTAPQGEVKDEIAKEVLREVIIPALENEVNTGKNFAQLRQVYHSLILATWYKKKIKESLLSSAYVDQKKVQGVNVDDPAITQKIWSQYVEAFKKGAFNLIKEEKDILTNETIPRKYFSGGMNFNLDQVLSSTHDSQGVLKAVQSLNDRAMVATVQLDLFEKAADFAQKAVPQTDALKFVTFEENPQALAIRKNPKATGYASALDFKGIDIEHDIEAMRRLKNRNLDETTELPVVLEHLEILSSGSRLDSKKISAYYDAIYEAIAEKGMDPVLADMILNGKYNDPELAKVIFDQNPDPKGQGVMEAIANAIDAMGGDIGQFGWGIKQMLDWLKPNDSDSLRFTTYDGQKAHGLDLIRGKDGQFYKTAPYVVPQEIPQGTRMALTVRQSIPKGSWEDGADKLTQIGLAKRALERFTFSHSGNILVRVSGEEERWVNGWESRETVMGTPHETKAKIPDITLEISEHGITLTDHGVGMSLPTMAQMFIPSAGGTKQSSRLQAEDIPSELKKTAVIHDTKDTSVHRISIIRNEERIDGRNDILRRENPEESILPEALVAGELALEFGRLVETSMARDKVIFPSEHNPKEPWPVAEGVVHMVKGILSSPKDVQEKLKYINTIITGLDFLVGNNLKAKEVMRAIKERTKKLLKDELGVLRENGFVILPHYAPYGRLQFSDTQKVVFLDPGLFDWEGARSLSALGADRVDPNVLRFIRMDKGVKQLIPLLIFPFKEDVLDSYKDFDFRKYDWDNAPPLPLVATKDFIALPAQWMARFKELSEKRLKGTLTDDELIEFGVWAQTIKVLSDPEKITSYEIGVRDETIALSDIPGRPPLEKGTPDARAINNFLVEPPQETLRPQQGQPEASVKKGFKKGMPNARFVIQNGRIKDLTIGHFVSIVPGDREKIETLGPKAFVVHSNTDMTRQYMVRVLESGLFAYEEIPGGQWLRTSNGMVVYIRSKGGLVIVNPETGEEIVRDLGVSKLTLSADRNYIVAQFSTGGIAIINTRSGNIREDITSSSSMSLNEDVRLPFPVPLVALKSKDGRNIIFDLEKQQELDRYLTSDPKGRFSVRKSAKAALIIHAHGTHKLTELAAVSGAIIRTVSFGGRQTIEDPEAWCTVTTDEGTYTVKGTLGYELEKKPGTAGGSIIVQSNGKVTFLGGGRGEEFFLQWFEESFPQWLEQSADKYYQHPDFNLYIDERDPAHKKAIRISNGEEIFFEGRILKFVEDGENYMMLVDNKGKLEILSHLGLYDTPKAVDSKDNPKFLILDNEAHESLRKLQLLALDKYRSEEVELPKSLATFGDVSFDGKYFVFSNPETGEVAFLDPEDPQNPVFGWPKEEKLQAREIHNELTQGKPNTRFVLEQGRVKDLEVGDYFSPEKGEIIKRIETLGSKGVLIYREIGAPMLWFVEADGNRSLHILQDGRYFKTPEGKIVYQSLTEAVLIFDPFKGEIKTLAAPEGKVQNFILTADGKYVVMGIKNNVRVVNAEAGDVRWIPNARIDLANPLPPMKSSLVALNQVTDNSRVIWDMSRERSVPDYLASDPDGLVSVRKTDGLGGPVGLELVSHVNGKRLSLVDGRLIKEVVFAVASWAGVTTPVISVYTTAKETFHYDNKLNLIAPQGEIDNNTEVLADGNVGFFRNETSVARNPLPGAFYKHPDFDLFIDLRDPVNPKAIRRLTGEVIPFQGKIVQFLEQEERWKMVTTHDGEVRISYPTFEDSKIGSHVAAAVDGGNEDKFILEHYDGADHRWVIDPLDKLDARRIFLPASLDGFSQASFDGKYFVFTKPETGEIAFLDVKKPQSPFFGWPEENLPQAPVVMQEEPENAPYVRLVVDRGRIKDLKTGQYFDLPIGGKASNIKTLGPRGFEVDSDVGPFILSLYSTETPSFTQVTSVSVLKASYGKVVFKKAGAKVVIFDPVTGQETVFEEEPQIRGLPSPSNWFYKLTADGNYMAVQKESSVQMVDIKTGETLKEIAGAKIDHNAKDIPARAPLITLTMLGSQEIYDVKNKSFIPNYVATDPQARFSVGTHPEGRFLMIYSHVDGKILKALNGQKIRSVSFGGNGDFDSSKYWAVVTTEDNEIFYVNEDLDANIMETPHYEKPGNVFIQVGGDIGFPRLVTLLDPSLRNSFYEHPEFGLYVDERDPNNKIAIRKSTQEKIPFEGKIIKFLENGERWTMITLHDGEVRLSYAGLAGPLRSHPKGYVDNEDDPKFIIEQESSAGQPSLWSFQYLDKEGSLRIILPESLGSFTQVSSDGRYFVFSNPETGEAAFLDPHDTQNPVFGWPKEKKTPVSGAYFTETKPGDDVAPYKIMTLGRLVEGFWHDGKGLFEDKELKFNRRIKGDTFVVETADGDEIMKPGNLLANTPMGWRYKTHSGRLVVFKDPESLDEQVYDVNKEETVPVRRFTKAFVDASGRFSLHEGDDGHLYYFDHEQERPTSVHIGKLSEWKDYRFDPYANAVVLETENRFKQVYMLGIGFVQFEDILVDTFKEVYFSPDGAFGFFVLPNGEVRWHKKTGPKNLSPADQVLFSEDDENWYLYREDKKTGTRIRKSDQKAFSYSDLKSFKFPQWWRGYQSNGVSLHKLGDSGVFTSHPVDDIDLSSPGHQELLLQKGLLTFDPNERLMTFRNTDSKGEAFAPKLSQGRLGALKGRKVGFLEGGESKVLFWVVGKDIHSLYAASFVNASRTYILEMDNEGKHPDAWLIDSQGERVDLGDIIPRGFSLVGVNGEVFVFYNKDAQQVRYFNPHLFMESRAWGLVSSPRAITPEQEQKWAQAKDLWRAMVEGSDSLRSRSINQARTAYEGFLSITPEEVKTAFTAPLDKLYSGQQSEALTRFRQALAAPAETPLETTAMPFDLFSKRMARVEKMKNVLEDLRRRGLGMDSGPRQVFYDDLFIGLFSALADPLIDFESNGYLEDEKFFEALGLGWQVKDGSTLEGTRDVIRLIQTLKEIYGDGIDWEAVQNMVRFLSAAASDAERLKAVVRQVRLLLDFPNDKVRERYLDLWYSSFSGIGKGEKILSALKDAEALRNLGPAKDFVIFLTSEAALIEDDTVPEYLPQTPQDKLFSSSKDGIGLEFIQEWSLTKPRVSADDDSLYSIEEMAEFLKTLEGTPLIQDYPETRETIAKNVRLQAEPGAYAREITQNSSDPDANAKNLKLRIYRDPQKKVLVEEWTDDGKGPPLGKALALLIAKSNKA
ncbi:MAG: hypothetical protein HQL16_07155, partial [Candidatus Omnitrophica bacterium]|nr:hypothetical protein [Candidatus Omnitrophota bacterium]